MTDFPGGKGGQPRLFIPTIDLTAVKKIQDPATQAAFTQVMVAMNAIKRWSDTLLLAVVGGGGLINYAYYTSANIGNPITWTRSFGNFTYVTGGTNIAFPANSVTLVIARIPFTFTGGLSDPIKLQLQILNAASSAIDQAPFEALSASGEWAASPTCSLIWDTASGALGATPLTVVSFEQNLSSHQLHILEFLTWSHP